MKILHTSDWHLGINFKGRSLEDVHRKFLSWLIETIKEENIDVLIVAGDIFDSYNPPNYALKMYHSFLAEAIKHLKDIFIIAGNHDSISTLEVSKDILDKFNIHVIADINNIDDLIFDVGDFVVCAVPFLRERFIKTNSLKLSESEIELAKGIKNFYEEVYKRAKKYNKKIIATGHLSVSGALFSDSEREIYIGKIKTIDKNIFKNFDYVALGHIHKPQKISEKIRYSGSPVPLSFSEKEEKQVLVIDENLDIKEIKVKKFKEFIQISGKFDEVKEKLEEIKDSQNPPFVEVYLDENVLVSKLDELKIEGVEIIAIKQKYIPKDYVLDEVDIEKLTPKKVFEKRLEMEDISEDEKERLIEIYEEIVKEVENEN